jgi:hypothetical protein
MPNDWNIDIAGQQGQQGPQGLAGGAMADAPSDSTVYGRMNAGWTRAVNRAGDTMTGALAVSYSLPVGATVSTIAASFHAGSYFVCNGYYDGSSWRYAGLSSVGALLAEPIAGGGQLLAAPTGSAGGVITWQNGINITGGNVAIPGQLNVNANTVILSAGIGYYGVQNGGDLIAFAWGSPYIYGYVGGGSVYAIASASDARLKQDIGPSAFDCLDAISRIQVREFRWMKHEDSGNPEPDPTAPLIPSGLIAQEVYEVAPHLAIKGNDISRGRIEEPMMMWNIDPNNLMATLVGAVQQLTARVAALEARLG